MSRISAGLFKGCQKKGKKLFLFFFWLAFFVFSPKVEASVASDALLGYWKFDTNTNLSDSSGDGSTASLAGTIVPSYSTERPTTTFPNSRSLNFNGADSYLTFANQTSLKPTIGVSLSFWIYLNAYPASSSLIAGNYLDNNNRGFFFNLGPSDLSFSVGSGSVLATASFPTSTVPVATWVLLTGTWDGTNVKLYRNGTLIHTTAFAGVVDYTGTTFQTGNYLGKMDDLRLYKRALTQVEVTSLASGQHTIATWNGSADVHYENPNNWTPTAVPDPYALISIATASNQPELAAPEAMAGLAIEDSAQLDLKTFGLTLNDSGTFSNNGILALANTQTLSNFSNDTNSGTVLINSATTTTWLKTGNEYHDLTIQNANGVAAYLNGNLTVHGNLTLASGNFATNNYNITLSGNWLNTGGTFLPGSGTVTLNGAGQLINGSNNFYDLTKIASSASTLTFGAGTTQTILNDLTLEGTQSASAQLLSLRSYVTGTAWNIDPQGARNISLVDVRDSNNVNTTAIEPQGRSINSSNNTNWTFDTTAPTPILDTVSSPSANSNQPVTGTATEAIATILSVEFQMEAVTGSWTACTANDGSFNGQSEPFTCTPSSLSDSAHTMYVRATDTNGNTTASSYPYANFTIGAHRSLTYLSGANGTITGTTPQSVTYNSSGTEVTAVANVHYHFVAWSDGVSTVTRTDTNVTTDKSVTANFAIDTYSLKYKSEDTGKIDGDASQTVDYGDSGSRVEAKPGTGYKFKEWSDGKGDGSRKDEDVSDDLTVTARFEKETYELKYSADAHGSIDGDTSQTVKYGEDGKTVTAVADKNYHFAKWSDGKTEKTRTDTEIKEKLSLIASFSADESSGDTSALTTTDAEALKKIDYNGETTPNWQTTYFGSGYCYEQAKCGGAADPDKDGVNNNEEFRLGTDPTKADSDQDGLSDNTEIETGHDPTVATKDNASDEIKFEDPKENGTTKKETYHVDNVEMVSSADGKKHLKVSGKATPNSFVTIYIHSDPIVLTVKTDADGNWSYIFDKDIGDGEHEVYVAVTDSTGKISEKSEPLAFVKTAEAITIIPPAQASATDLTQSPVETSYQRSLFLSIAIGIFGLVLAMATIGFIRRKKTLA